MLDKNPTTRIKMHQIMQNSWLFPERVFSEFASTAEKVILNAELPLNNNITSVITPDQIDNEENLHAIFKRYDLDYKPSFLPLIKNYIEKTMQDQTLTSIDLDGLMLCIKKSIEILANHSH